MNMRNTVESKFFNHRIGKMIRKLRVERKWTQEELASQMDVTATFISNLERGGSGLNAYNLMLLCEVFEVSPNQFLMWDLETENEALRKNYIDISKLCKEKQEIVIKTINLMLKDLESGINSIR